MPSTFWDGTWSKSHIQKGCIWTRQWGQGQLAQSDLQIDVGFQNCSHLQTTLQQVARTSTHSQVAVLRDVPWPVSFSRRGIARLSLLLCITEIFSLPMPVPSSPLLPTADLHTLVFQLPLIFMFLSPNYFFFMWMTLFSILHPPPSAILVCPFSRPLLSPNLPFLQEYLWHCSKGSL